MLEKADVKALECEIPVELLQGLNLQEDGTVDLESLLKICHRANRLDALKKYQKTIKPEISEAHQNINPDLMDLIFNPDIAADFSNKINQTK
jgi:hypothetical protein